MELKNPIWFCIPRVVKWLVEARDRDAHSLNDEVRAGINFSIILNSACFLEGALESGLIAVLESHRNGDDPLSSRLSDEVKERVSWTTGYKKYDELFELVVGVAAHDLTEARVLWDGVKSLFTLRNVLAHGRAVSHKLVFPSGKNARWREELTGNYKSVHGYLLQKQLIPKQIVPLDGDWFFLADSIADHFWNLATSFIVAVGNSLSETESKVFKEVTHIPSQFQVPSQPLRNTGKGGQS